MSKVKVVMMTALGQAEDRTRGEALGVVKYLVKSQVTLEDFVRVIKEALGAGSDESSAQGSQTSDQVPKDKAANNQQQGEQPMPDDTKPAPASPANVSGAPSVTNPISGGDTPAVPGSDQMSVAQAHDAMQSQVDDFASSSTSPGTPMATNTPDIPVATPPSDPPPSDDPQPPTPPPSPDMPTTT